MDALDSTANNLESSDLMTRLLVIEDEEKLRRVIHHGLQEQGYEVVSVGDANLGWTSATAEAFDCIILDRMLPDRDGILLLQDLRTSGNTTPVLMITALGEVEQRVQGLDAGADDYISKPFAWVELLARVKACLRRVSLDAGVTISAGRLRLDCVQRRLSNSETSLEITSRECDLLRYLIRHAGETLTRDQLARDVWQEPEIGLTNVVDVYIAKLRKRMDRLGEPDRIETIRGIGYRFEDRS